MRTSRLAPRNHFRRLFSTVLLAAACFYPVRATPAADRFWDGNVTPPTAPNGVFDVANNWNPNQVPVSSDTAIFNRDATYTVTFDSNEVSGGLRVDAGTVTFASNSANTRTYTLSGLAPVMHVRGDSTLNIGLISGPDRFPVVVDGAVQLLVGTSSGNGLIVVDGANSRLDVPGILGHTIGGDGFEGTLRYQNGAQGAISGTLRIGDSANAATRGALGIFSGADLMVGNLVLGAMSSGPHFVTVDGNGSTLVQTGARTVTIGGTVAGSGFNVLDDGVFSTGTGGVTINSSGQVFVYGGTFNANSDVDISGRLQIDFGGTFKLAAGKTITASNDARIAFGEATDLSESTAWNIQSGADLVAASLGIGTAGIGTTTLTIDGAGSTVSQTPASTLTLGHASSGSAKFDIQNGATFTTGTAGSVKILRTGTLSVKSGGRLLAFGNVTLDGGVIHVDGGAVNLETLNFMSGAINVTGDLTMGFGGLLNASQTISTDHELSVTGTTTIAQFRTLTLEGGSFSTGELSANGRFDFRRGTLSITGAGGLTIGSGGPLGAAVTLGAGQTLNVINTATVQPGASLLMQTGGMFNAATLANNGSVTLDGVNSTLGGGVVNNSGVLRGDGRVTAAVNNLAAGEIRGEQGKTLRFTGTSGPNNGRITLQGGALQFSQPLTNAASGVISGRGALFFDGGLTNEGKMQFSGGPTDVYGNVSFTGGTGGGELINSGGANVVTFYGNVTHNGDEIRTSPTNTTVFFGDVTGAGPFTGTGAVRFEGSFAPGNSPAAVEIEGDVQLGADARLQLELGGTKPAVQYDQLHIGGVLSLDGSLDVSLLDGFVPSYGATFDLLDSASLVGQFETVHLPALDGGLGWDTTSLYTTGAITAVPEPGAWLLVMFGVCSLAVKTLRRRLRAARRTRSIENKLEKIEITLFKIRGVA
jgi:autotransporter family porin